MADDFERARATLWTVYGHRPPTNEIAQLAASFNTVRSEVVSEIADFIRSKSGPATGAPNSFVYVDPIQLADEIARGDWRKR